MYWFLSMWNLEIGKTGLTVWWDTNLLWFIQNYEALLSGSLNYPVPIPYPLLAWNVAIQRSSNSSILVLCEFEMSCLRGLFLFCIQSESVLWCMPISRAKSTCLMLCFWSISCIRDLRSFCIYINYGGTQNNSCDTKAATG